MKYPKCPYCGAKMTIFDGVSWYTCPKNCTRVCDQGDGAFLDAAEIFKSDDSRRDIEPEEWQKFEDGWRPDY